MIMTETPIYWKTTLEDVEETLKLVKKGTVTQIATSAGGRPIYQIEYGQSNVKMGTANCSSALGAHNINYFADKTGADYIPTVYLGGCIHGGEFEGTMAILNLIKLIETGTDYAGNEYPELLDLATRVHLILVPIHNPDGRARVPMASVLGMTFLDFRYYNQGTWKHNGELCGWPGCKMIHPIKEASGYLGAYFNDDGVNMMHEDYFGNISKESMAVLDICRKYAPDFSVLLHGGTNSHCGILPPDYTTEASLQEALTVSKTLKERSEREGTNYHIYQNRSIGDAFMLQTAMHHLCGGVAVTYESNQGLLDAPGMSYTPDEIYYAHRALFEEIIKFELKKYGKEVK